MEQEATKYGFVDDQILQDWERKFPVGASVGYLGKKWKIVENREHFHTSDNGYKNFRRKLLLSRINKDDFVDAIYLPSQRLAELMVKPVAE